MAIFDKYKTQITQAEAAEVSEGFKPLQSGAYKSIITKFGVYRNRFDNDSMYVEVLINEDGKEITLSVDRGLTLKDGSQNNGTLSMMHEIFSACGVSPDTVQPATDTAKTFGQEVQLEAFKECYNKEVAAFVRETFEEGARYERGNIIEAIFNVDGKNSDGVDQLSKFKEKIEKQPILVKKSKEKASTGTAGTPATGSSAAARL